MSTSTCREHKSPNPRTAGTCACPSHVHKCPHHHSRGIYCSDDHERSGPSHSPYSSTALGCECKCSPPHNPCSAHVGGRAHKCYALRNLYSCSAGVGVRIFLHPYMDSPCICCALGHAHRDKSRHRSCTTVDGDRAHIFLESISLPFFDSRLSGPSVPSAFPPPFPFLPLPFSFCFSFHFPFAAVPLQQGLSSSVSPPLHPR
mmetsp:Transcript_13175/g.25918  ORF Transcript_13175/g.25918 Transcript_13175/m.25918 type:complete len:202 (+) Transcript_13175:311-916(+)